MDNTGRMSGTINKQWFLYQEKEVFQDKRQKKLILILSWIWLIRENQTVMKDFVE